jgi:hypothetical protein
MVVGASAAPSLSRSAYSGRLETMSKKSECQAVKDLLTEIEETIPNLTEFQRLYIESCLRCAYLNGMLEKVIELQNNLERS